MDSKASSLLFFALFLAFFSASSAFNITMLLDRHPDFSSMNDYLSKTQLDKQINSRNTITVLAVDNKAIAGLSGLNLDEVRKILSVHVVLDYYDVQKLSTLTKKSTLLTTLFQASGTAMNQQGFVNVSIINEGEIAFGSGVKGSKLDSKLVKSVAAQPFNISVLQISSAIVPPGITVANPPGASPPPTNAPTPRKAPTPGKAPAPAGNSPAQSPSNNPVPEAPSPTGAGTPEESPAPVADTPAEADTPAGADTPAEADTPAGADSPAEANAPATADSPGSESAEAPAPEASTTASASSRTTVASGVVFGVVMGLVSSLVA
ncbi:fasciclin-like arabinogalactan protein 14 [Quercus lobata]|uniref:FAS1 domain-containing protein n=1 Tax=Quercus lobata TaxID=97700 RepID=A0A7N2N3F5_QUELO|nr:fasciclin-like arabinogalactan protein 14 [Quercus lobata]